MTRRTDPAILARLSPGAGRREAPPLTDEASHPAQEARRARCAATGRLSQQMGETAERYVDQVCEGLLHAGRLWWVRIEDPMRPLKRMGEGKYLCAPQPRPHATDRVGAILVDGVPHLAAWEIKSVDVDHGSWSLSELRPAQVASLTLADRFHATACVLLVALQAATVVRALYVLPWHDGQLPLVRAGAPLKLDDPALEAYRIPLAAAATWIDHAELAHNRCRPTPQDALP